MRKVELYGNLEEVVEQLKFFRKIGLDVYCEFNGHVLLSRNITLDLAYLEVTGLTYKDFKRREQEEIEKWKKEREESKERARAKKPEWIARGHKLIKEELWSEWERCIDIRIDDLYNGVEIEHSLKVMEDHMEGKPISEIKTMIDSQGHSGCSYRIFISIIKTFYIHGEELIKQLQQEEEKPNKLTL